MSDLKTSRWAAQLAFEKHYLGQECARGHGRIRYASNGTCVECTKHPTGKTGRADTVQGRSQDAREAAEAKGELYYLAAAACPNGHFKRYTSNGTCVECQKVRRIQWTAQHPTYHTEYNRKWYAANRDYALLRDRARREKRKEEAQCRA